MRGPRAGVIFFRKGVKTPAGDAKPAVMYDFENKINQAVFPGLQGGPHNHAIAAIAVAMKHAQTDEFKQYQQQVLIILLHFLNKYLFVFIILVLSI